MGCLNRCKSWKYERPWNRVGTTGAATVVLGNVDESRPAYPDPYVNVLGLGSAFATVVDIDQRCPWVQWYPMGGVSGLTAGLFNERDERVHGSWFRQMS